MMVRVEFLKNIDYSNKFEAWFDWWFNSQISRKGPFYFLPEEKTLWRVHKDSFNYKYVREVDMAEKVKQMRTAIINGVSFQPEKITSSGEVLSDNQKSAPLFLIGSARSGTTLLQRVLNSAKGNYIFGEHGGFLKQIAESYNLFGKEDIAKNIDFKTGNIQNHVKDPRKWVAWSNKFDKEDLKNYYKNFIINFFRPDATDVGYWGFKEIRYCDANNNVLKFLLELFPEAKFVFIVRNPFDVLKSQIQVFDNNERNNFRNRVNDWKNRNRLFLEFLKDEKENCFLIKYEDLIDKNSPSLKDLFLFLGLDFTKDQTDVLDLKSGRGESKYEVNYKEFFSTEEIKKIKYELSELSTKYGYNLDN
jgi:hypothetical protein